MDPHQNIKIILTEDGSHSLHLPDLDETYHSVHGAIQESEHVFINAGLVYWLEVNPSAAGLDILEFGFGTGLNALLTAAKVSGKLSVRYEALEKYPLPAKITKTLNYGEVLQEAALFNRLHSTPWDKEITINETFVLKKLMLDFRDFVTKRRYDLIYFDAFAPSKQPELWIKEIFEYCYRLLHTGGVFVTYSAKGQLKRDLSAIGFEVESLPGPPGKFEITRAIKR